MELKICANCGRLHLDDGKRLIVDGVMQPLKCKCIAPKVMTVSDWLKYISIFNCYNKVLTNFIKKHKLYGFAFKSANEPYYEQYSDRIKNAIVDTTYSFDKDGFAEILLADISMLKEFYDKFDMARRMTRYKEYENEHF